MEIRATIHFSYEVPLATSFLSVHTDIGPLAEAARAPSVITVDGYFHVSNRLGGLTCVGSFLSKCGSSSYMYQGANSNPYY